MKLGRWVWIGVGAGVGYVLGAKAGTQRYEQLTGWTRQRMDDLGIAPAASDVMGAAREATIDVGQQVAQTSSEAVRTGADRAVETVEAARDTVTSAVSDLGPSGPAAQGAGLGEPDMPQDIRLPDRSVEDVPESAGPIGT